MATKVKLIETGAVTGNIIPDGGIATGKLADDAVTTIKISDANITHAKLHTSMDLTGKTVTVATAAGSTNTTAAASTAFVQQELTTLIGGAPSTLNDLNELAAAINDDANYNSTLTTALATKLPLAGGTLTGNLTVQTLVGINKAVNSAVGLSVGSDAASATSYGLEVTNNSANTRFLVDGLGSQRFYGSDNAETARFTDGKLGIGTIAPGYLLTVKKDVDAFAVKIENDGNSAGTSGASYADASDGLWVDTRWNTATNTPFKVTSNSGTTPMMTIKGNGNVGIGTATPDYNLEVEGASGTTIAIKTPWAQDAYGQYKFATPTGEASMRSRVPGNSTVGLEFYTYGTNNGTAKMSIDGSGNVDVLGNINLTGGGTIEAPSVGGGETLTLKAAGGITAIIDSNGNGGDGEFFRVQKHTGDNLLTVQETGAVEVTGTLNASGTLSATASVGVNQLFYSTYNYGSNRDWAFRTNNYGSSNWGGFSLEQSTSQQGTPSVARIGVHMNGNVGIKMGGHATSGLTTLNPATALHVGGDITVGTAESVGTSGAAAIRFVNDNERSRITSNYASGGGGQMGFWTDSSGGTLLQRAYIKNDGSFNFNGPVKMHSNYWGTNDVMKTYSITGPSSNSLTRTINVNTYWDFAAQGGAFMYMLHGWQGDSAMGMVHWSNAGNNTQVIVGVYHNELVKTGLTSITVAKGSGNYDIDITLAGTHSNTHGWYWKVWA